MNDIRITELDNGRLAAITPYHSDFIADAKQAGGRWNRDARAWTFDARDRDRLSTILRKHFGTDGSPEEAEDLVTVRTALHRHEISYREGAKARFAGRLIASRPGRDADVRLADNVVLIAGQLSGRGGSMRYPEIDADDDVIVEIRDIPRAALKVEDADTYEIVNEDTGRIETLRERRATLLAELAEIDAELAAAGEPTDDTPQGNRAVPAEAGTPRMITARIDNPTSDGWTDLDDDGIDSVTVAAYADMVGRSARTIRRWCAAGRISARRTAHGWRIAAAA